MWPNEFFNKITKSILGITKRVPFKKVGLYLFGGILFLAAGYGIVAYAPVEKREQIAIAPEEESNEFEILLSETELFEAINEQRKLYSALPLITEESTCALAEARVDEVYEKGTDVFGRAASFQRTIDRVVSDTSLDPNTIPEYYKEYLTYEETIEDAINTWSEANNELFTDINFRLGCVAEKDGYAIVIVGFNKSKPKQIDKKTYYETNTFPKNLERNPVKVI